jgi:transcriptional regulator with XRE-family HTH domain
MMKKKNIAVFLPEFLQKARIQAGLTQLGVAKKLGYSTGQFVSNWERGQGYPPTSTLRKLSVLYGVSPEQVFKAVLQSVLIQTEVALRQEFDWKKNKSA